MKKILTIMLVLAMVFTMGSSMLFAADGDVVEGVSSNPAAYSSVPGFLDFDPSCVFGSSIPIMLENHPSTNLLFAGGNGAVLDECGGFGVTGHSSPNFLAWNCTATNADGSVPELPGIMFFPSPVSAVELLVGSSSGSGATATLVALNSSFNPVAFDELTLSTTMQTLAVQAPAIKAAVLLGPCVMVADDITYN